MKNEGKTDKPVIIGYDRRFMSEDALKYVAEPLLRIFAEAENSQAASRMIDIMKGFIS